MTQPIETFLSVWIEGFAREMEIFSGTKLAIAPTPVTPLPETESLLWYRQSFSSSEGSFLTWIGAPEPTWTALAGADAENAQTAYLEIVNQVQSGAATVASRSLQNPISADAGEIAAEADFDPSAFHIYSLAIDGGRLPALVIAIDKNAEGILPGGGQSLLKSSVSNTPTVPESLLDLELPVAISLGYAEIPIKSVLNVRPGMPIELSTENGEDLELLVHGTVIARGEITMVKGNYALKIKQIVGAEDRLSLLKR